MEEEGGNHSKSETAGHTTQRSPRQTRRNGHLGHLRSFVDTETEDQMDPQPHEDGLQLRPSGT